MQDAHCRLCAELKRADKLLNLETDTEKYNEVQTKLVFLNANYVDISTNITLPVAICLVCYDALNKVHEFLNKVRKAQDLISALSASKETDKNLQEIPSFTDIFNSEPLSNSLKPESSSSSNTNFDVQVKLERNYSDNDSLIPSVQNLNPDSLNVHDILEAAFSPFSGDNKYDSDVEMYAKEVTFSPKTEINADEIPLIKLKRKSKRKEEKNKKKCKKIKKEVDLNRTVKWGDYPWVCVYCKVQFQSIDMLRHHAKEAHSKCGAFMCVDCNYYTHKDDYEGFIKHVRKHRVEYRNICQYCDGQFKPRHLSEHIAYHLTPPRTACVSCGEIFNDEEAFKGHIQSYMSRIVPKKPRRKPNTPLTKQDLTCGICHNVYKTMNSLRDHNKSQHGVDRRREFTCDKCGKMYYSKGTLTSHVMKHDEIKPHACRICSRAFLFPNQLRRHVESHTGVKPYPCAQCGRRFRLRRQLLNHQIIHTDAMPYKCSHCTKTFRFKQILVNHERQHTGAKPYECEVCGMQFTCWSNYNKHMKRRHNTDTARKKITAQGVFPVDPVTGQVIQPVITGLEEWKEQIMLPVKRGKKPAIKTETTL